MLNLGLIGFTSPWLLAALVLLPALWWLLRLIPPSPRRLRFPAVRFLLGLVSREETPRHTPPWLLLLRLVLVTLLILALAGPVLHPEAEQRGEGPLVLVVDDGWAAAPAWEARREALLRQGERAVRDQREVVLLRTAPGSRGAMIEHLGATEALRMLGSLQPRPWPVDRAAALAALEAAGIERADVVWLSDGLAGSEAERGDAARLGARLAELGPLRVLADPPVARAHLLRPPEVEAGGLVVAVERAAGGAPAELTLRAIGPAGEVLARRPLAFAADDTRASLRLDLPLELRNRIARLDLEPEVGAGAAVLLDERWRRRVVGLIGPGQDEAAQPLLSELYYLDRALAPHAELRLGSLRELLERRLSVLVMADVARVEPAERARIESWIEEGGVLLRFAGPRLAASADSLVPVRLRQGDRQLGGALSWAQPLALASFDEDGPLAGLRVPPDVTVARQVLAQPGPELAGRIWARLEDGTPLITGERRGEGWLILVHTTANTAWSNLALSGTYVEILRRVLALAPGVGGEARGTLQPLALLDGFGRLVAPAASAAPLAAEALATTRVGPRHPPGLYGPAPAGTAAEESARHALNLAPSVPALLALGPAEHGAPSVPFQASRERALGPWLLTLALLLALVDAVIALALRGLLPRLGRPATAAALLLLALPAGAVDDDWAIAATSETRLAYVVTGNAQLDEQSRAGLYGLGRVLHRRTAIEVAEPLAIDLARDELSLLPLLYWPVTRDHPPLAAGVLERIDAYLQGGGMILFDTKDAAVLLPGQAGPGPGERRLAEILAGLNLAALDPVPADHALTRAFYLLQEFPGRFTGQRVWVDRPSPGVNDEVSSVIIGAHDWAGAWAIDVYGDPLLPVLPGGETQREMARRFGVNLVMYALTGNYKTDQVHIPALLERLGQ